MYKDSLWNIRFLITYYLQLQVSAESLRPQKSSLCHTLSLSSLVKFRTLTNLVIHMKASIQNFASLKSISRLILVFRRCFASVALLLSPTILDES